MATFTLPNELWVRVLQNLDNDEDRPELWMVGRHVCTSFRDIIQSIFRERYLPRTMLIFNLKMWEEEGDGQLFKAGFHAIFDFSRVSEDGRTATFQLEDDEDRTEAAVQILRGFMQEHTKDIDFEAPSHSIRIRHLVHDSPIPLVSFDEEKDEVSCHWLDMFTAFYGEEMLGLRLAAERLDNQGSYLEELKAKMSRGEIRPDQAIELAILEVGTGEETSRSHARRLRIQHQYRERDGTNWDPEKYRDTTKEIVSLGRLKICRHLADETVFSDEEDNDDWEDEEDGENEDQDTDASTEDE